MLGRDALLHPAWDYQLISPDVGWRFLLLWCATGSALVLKGEGDWLLEAMGELCKQGLLERPALNSEAAAQLWSTVSVTSSFRRTTLSA